MNRMLSVVIVMCLLSACNGGKKQKQDQPETVKLDEETIVLFAKQIEASLLRSESSIFNNAFDQAYIRKKISENSIVASSLDASFGQKYFEENFHEGDIIVRQIENGGDFKFLRYYVADGEHHIIFRTYSDFGIKIDDYTIHLVNNEMKIKDGYMYNLGTTLTDNIKYDILYRVMEQTDPGGPTHYIGVADSLCKQGKYRQAFSVLKEQKEALKSYPYYWYLYVMSMYNADNKAFISNLKAVSKEEGLDERYTLTHELLYYANQGKIDSLKKVIVRLEEYTGTDPVYSLFEGKSNYYAGNYEDAVKNYRDAEEKMDLLWDIWHGMLECYNKLNDAKNFYETLMLASEKYGMNKKEIAKFVAEDFPNMAKTEEFKTLKD